MPDNQITTQELTEGTSSYSVATKVEAHDQILKYLMIGIAGSLLLLSLNAIKENSLSDKISATEIILRKEINEKQLVIDCFKSQFQNYWNYPKCFK